MGRQAAGQASGADLQPDLPTVTESTFRAMGTACRLVIGGGPADLAARAAGLVHELERRWSRFDPDSEISQLNGRPGHVTILSEATFGLIRRAAHAHDVTAGRFNPLLLDQLEQAGYRRSWDADGSPPRPEPQVEATVDPGITEPVQLYPDLTAARLPEGCRFDPGGIGKGLAVDLVTEYCIDSGATSLCVDLGGDLRVHGQSWYGPRWRIGVEHPFDPTREIAAFTPTGGAVATSTTLRRSWSGRTRRLHHLLDPATGRPSTTDLVSVTTCSSATWWAEVAAKTALLAGSAGFAAVLHHLGTPGVAVTGDGQVLTPTRSHRSPWTTDADRRVT